MAEKCNHDEDADSLPSTYRCSIKALGIRDRCTIVQHCSVVVHIELLGNCDSGEVVKRANGTVGGSHVGETVHVHGLPVHHIAIGLHKLKNSNGLSTSGPHVLGYVVTLEASERVVLVSSKLLGVSTVALASFGVQTGIQFKNIDLHHIACLGADNFDGPVIK